ncbi:hypothetical protein FA13DRAFT_1713793 [Coprinellus micaceus]|uniref:F-box domain-containing protein n=1 Tax=Coprinellus micaceus TaxID=71717 RepID=A0A4Y7SVK5_COPMI|nr:hypothetical protein FA13DRAFT_1713793 [Coprinellus micaceus]
MAHYIPPELVETIINFVSHRPTLKACTLTGPAFTIPAHRALFAEVTLSPPKSRCHKRTPAHRFLNLLTSSPHLVPFVHSLIVECEDSVEGFRSTAACNPTNDRISAKANLSWTSLSSSLRTALVSLIRSGSVVDLELGGFSRIPVSSVIDSGSRLKKLSLLPLYLVDDTQVPMVDSEEGDEAPSPNRVHLEDIKIKQSAVALRRTADWLLSPTCHLDVGQLKRLHFEVSSLEDHHHVSRIVETCSDSLEYLEVSPGSEVNSIRHLLRNVPAERRGLPAFHLNALNTLKALRINTKIVQFKMNNNRYSDPTPWLVSVLSTLPEDNGLSSLDLSFALELDQEVLSRVSWQELTSVLATKKFEGLQRVNLNFPRSNKESAAGERRFWVRETVAQNQHLSPLLTRGFLSINL